MLDPRSRFPGIIDTIPPDDGIARAGVLVPLFPDGDDIRMVLTKRPMTMPTHAGHLAFPGGRPDPDDPDVVHTALREAHEEMGIVPGDVDVLGYLEAIHTVEFSLYVVPVVGWLPPDPTLIPSEREVDKVLLPTISSLSNEDAWRFELWQGRRIWFFDIDGEVLWGATAMLTRRLLGLEP
ncbi:MAG: CoA pyrophosphatase [Acidimicrobiia bacterium]|nr:CoA pyrophosphatase [Acidimicrobiia bacterium]